ncbi:MAG: helix-turn-helix domain-containing protein [Proteobacteria bacterium]|nr:helix-turn-helix domain-containing protein [Pseudomonadota bacterium]
MRLAREAQGFSLAEVANALKLNVRQVDALEAGRFDDLPGPAFTRGFLRNYARLLKLDVAPLLAHVDRPGDGASVELTPASNAHGDIPQVGRGRFRKSILPGVLAAAGLFGVVVAGWYFDTQKKAVDDVTVQVPSVTTEGEQGAPAPQAQNALPAVVPPAPVQPSETATSQVVPPPGAESREGVAPVVAPVAQAPAVVVPTPTTPSQPPAEKAVEATPARPVKPAGESGADQLVFEFSQDAWVEVKDRNGKILLSQLGKAGVRREVSGNAPFSLVVGNARYVKLQRNGAPVDLTHDTKVTVARLKLE